MKKIEKHQVLLRNILEKRPRCKQKDDVQVWWNRMQYYIQSNKIHNVVAQIKFLLVLRFELYMFWTVTVHPQELLYRYCICRQWYMVRNALPNTSSWYNIVLPTTLYQLAVLGSVFLNTYHSLHIQYLQRSFWGWTVTVQNMSRWHLSTNKNLISATTLCISLFCIYIAKMIHGPSNVKDAVDSSGLGYSVIFWNSAVQSCINIGN